MLDHLEQEGFLRGTPRQWIVRRETPEALLEALLRQELPAVRRWLRLGDT